MTVPDFPDEKAPDAHATAISLTGAPPLVFKRVIDVQLGTSIAAGGTLTRPASGAFSLNQPGYEIQLNVGTLGGVAPIVSVELQWYDSAFGLLMDSEIYYFYSGDVNGHQIHGRGPSKGDQVIVVIKNYSGTSGVSVTYTLLQTSRTFTREFWKTITKGTVQPVLPGLTMAPGNMESGWLMGLNTSIPASGNLSRVLPLYTGTVRLNGIAVSGAAGNLQWVLNDNTNQLVSGPLAFQGTNGQAGFAPFGASSLYAAEIPLPRSQQTLTISNNLTTTLTAITGIVAAEDRA